MLIILAGAVLSLPEITTAQARKTSCGIDISPANQSFSADGGRGNVHVRTSQNNCPWIAKSTVSWISVTSGGKGRTSGRLHFNVRKNTGTKERSGAITVANKTITIKQDGVGRARCSFTLTPASKGVSHTRNSYAVNVTASQPHCTWQVHSHADWLSVSLPKERAGSGTVMVTVQPNMTTKARQGQISVGRNVYARVHQAGRPAPCTVTIEKTGEIHGPAGEQGVVKVTASDSRCRWYAQDDVPWITTTPGPRYGSQEVRYTLQPNDSYLERTGSLMIEGKPFTITQKPCTFVVSPKDVVVSREQQTTTITVKASAASCSWSAMTGSDWLGITSAKTGRGDGSIQVSLSRNMSSESRSSLVRVANNNVLVSQDGIHCSYTLDRTGANHGPGAEQGSFAVTASDSQCLWSIQGGAPWVQTTPGLKRGSQIVHYTVSTNQDNNPRSVQVRVKDRIFTIIQRASATRCSFRLGGTMTSFRYTGGRGRVGVTASTPNCLWSARSDVSWIKVHEADRKGSQTVSYTVQRNEGPVRKGTLTIAGHIFTVTQSGAASSLETKHLEAPAMLPHR